MKLSFNLILMLFLVFASCKKDADRSERWQVEDWCEPKSSTVVCGDHIVHITTICCEQLDKAAPGIVIVTSEDANVKRYRRFLQKQ